MRIVPTWLIEMVFVATVLIIVASVRGGLEWIAAAAVLASFGHASVSERMRERDASRSTPEVSCLRWTWRYFIVKEALWISYFLLLGAYASLVGCFVFLAYPLWRSWWRRRHPLLVIRGPLTPRTEGYWWFVADDAPVLVARQHDALCWWDPEKNCGTFRALDDTDGRSWDGPCVRLNPSSLAPRVEDPVMLTGVDVRPRCRRCGERWWPDEGQDAQIVPCPICRRRASIAVVPTGEGERI